MARRLGGLYVNLAANVGEFVRGVQRATNAQQRYADSLRRMRTRVQRFNRAAGDLPRLLLRQRSALLGLVGAGGLGLAVRQFLEAADALQQVQSRLQIVSDSTAEFTRIQTRLFEISQDTRSDFLATVGSYARLALAARQSGIETERILQLQRTLNQTFIISGSTAREAAAASIQFAQGMASGRLQGDELRSVLENNVRLAQALSDAFGVNVGVLRDLAAEGFLNVSNVVAGLEGQIPRIEAEFGQVVRTVGQAVQQLRNDLFDSVGVIRDTAETTTTLTAAIDRLREAVSDTENIETFTSVLGSLIDGLSFVVENAENIARSAGIIATALSSFLGITGVVIPVARFVLGWRAARTAASAAGAAAASAARNTDNLTQSIIKNSRTAGKGAVQTGRLAEAASRAEGDLTTLTSAAIRGDLNLALFSGTAVAAAVAISASWEEATRSLTNNIEQITSVVDELTDSYEAQYGQLGNVVERQRELATELSRFRDFQFSGEDIFGAMTGIAGVGEAQDAARATRELIVLDNIYAATILRNRQETIRANIEAAALEREAAIERDRRFGKLFRQETDLQSGLQRRLMLENEYLQVLRIQDAAISARQTSSLGLVQATRSLVVAAGTEEESLDRVNELLAFRSQVETERLSLQQRITAAEVQRVALQERLLAAYDAQDLPLARQLETLLQAAIQTENLANVQRDAYNEQLVLLQQAFELDAARREQVREYNREVERSNELLAESFRNARDQASVQESPVSTVGEQLADAERILAVAYRTRTEQLAVNAVLESQAEAVARIDEVQRRANEQRRIAAALEQELENARMDAQRGVLVLTQETIAAREQEIAQARERGRVLDSEATRQQDNLQQELDGIATQGQRLMEVLEQLAEANAIRQLRDTITNAFRGFANSVLTDFENIENAARRLGQTIIAAIFDRIVAQRFASAIGSLFDRFIGGGGPGVGGGVGNFLAAGGPARQGVPYIVGEQGPELFVPNVSGNVVPNSRLNEIGGGITIVYSPTINGSDRETVMRVLEEGQAQLATASKGGDTGGHEPSESAK